MEDKVLNAMKEAGKPVRPGDIAKALGVDSKEVSKACAELKKAGKIHSPKRCYYEPVADEASPCLLQSRTVPQEDRLSRRSFFMPDEGVTDG